MANYANLLATIAANIYTNNNGEVTAAMVKTAVDQVVASLSSGGYLFKGIATPTSPGTAQTPDERVFYIATTPGTYTYLGGLVVNDGEVAILRWDTAWSREVVRMPFVYGDGNDLDFIELADKAAVVSGGGALNLYAVQDSQCALLYVERMVGEKLVFHSRQFSGYSSAYIFTDNHIDGATVVSSGVFDNGVAYKKVITVPAGAKWLFLNYDPSEVFMIYQPVPDEVQAIEDDTLLYEREDLMLLSPTISAGKFAGIAQGVVSLYNIAQSTNYSYNIDSARYTKLFFNYRAVRLANYYRTSYIFTDNENNVIAESGINTLRMRGVVNIPAGATRLYINADVADDNVFVGAFTADIVQSSSEKTELSLKTLTPFDGYAAISQGKVGIYPVQSSKCLIIPADSIPADRLYLTVQTTPPNTNAACVIVDYSGAEVVSYRVAGMSNYVDYEITIPAGSFYIYINFLSGTTPKIAARVSPADMDSYLKRMSLNGGLWDKSCVTFGDSITANDNNAFNGGKEVGVVAKGYQTHMRAVGMVVTNRGHGGATMPYTLSVIQGTDVSGYDYVTLTSGANDSRYQTPVGALDVDGGPYDTTTFIGALQTAIEYILTNNPTAKILLITPIKGWIYYPNGYEYPQGLSGDGVVEQKYADAIKEVAEFYSLPVCDWYNTAGLNLLTRSWYINDLDPDPSQTPNPNDKYSLHPTNEGYERMAAILLPCLRNI